MPIRLGVKGIAHLFADLFHRGPDVAQVNVFAFLVPSQHFRRQIFFNSSGERERHHQRRAHQEVRFDALMHARFKVAIAGKHARSDQIMIVNNVFDSWIEWAGISNTRRATVADQIETELIQVRLQSRLLEILSDDPRARRE